MRGGEGREEGDGEGEELGKRWMYIAYTEAAHGHAGKQDSTQE